MKKRMVATVVSLLAAFSSWGAKYPSVSNSGEVYVNKWTSQVSKAVEAAAANNVPMLITFVNHGANGNCGHCATWAERCVSSSSSFASFIQDRPMILVMVNKADDKNFDKYYWKYLGSNANNKYPGMAIWSANGKLLSSLNAIKSGDWSWSKVYPNEAKWQAWIAKYVPVKPRVSTVNLSQGATITAGETYSGSISYTQGAGDVVVRLSSDDAQGVFSATEFTLPTGNGSGSVSFTFTPSLTPNIMDDAVISLSKASGDANLGTQSLTLTIKNADVKQTLAQYAASKGLNTLVAPANDWYLDQNDVLRSAPIDSGFSTELAFTPSESGVLAIGGASVDGVGTLTVQIDGTESAVDATTVTTIGLTKGQRVVFTGAAVAPAPENQENQENSDETDASVFKLGSLSFTPYAPVALTAPANGAAIQLRALQADHSLVDLAWNPLEGASSYVLNMGATADGMANVYEGDCAPLNAIDLGVVTTETAQGTVYAAVDALIPSNTFDYASDDVTVYGTINTFSIVANPEFPADSVTFVTAYQKLPVSVSFTAASLTPVTYSASGLPSGLKIDASSGTVSGSTLRTGTFSVAIMAHNSSGTTTHWVTFSVKAAKTLKTKCTGLVYQGDGRTLAGTLALSVSANGKATAKLALPGKVNVKGSVTSKGEGLSFSQGGLSLTRRSDGVWIGSYKGYRVVARTAGSGNTGTFTAALANNGTIRGYASVTVKAKGKVKTICKLPDTKQASISATGINLTADQAAAAGIFFPAGVGGTALYFPVFKKGSGVKLSGIGVVCSGTLTIPSASWKGVYSETLSASGRKYTASLGGYAGRTFQVVGRSGNVVASFTLSASKSSVTAGSSKTAKFNAKAKTGLFTASVRIGKKKVNLKGALVPAETVAAAVGKSGSTYYYGGLQ